MSNQHRLIALAIVGWVLFPVDISAQEFQASKYPNLNLQLSFPGPTTTSVKGNGIIEVAYDGSSSFCTLYYDKSDANAEAQILDGRLTRKSIFEQRVTNTLQAVRGQLIESSPIRWQGHFGQEFAVAYKGRRSGELRVARYRQILVNATSYVLEYDSMVFLEDADADWLRHHDREAALQFFDSMKLQEHVPNKAKPQSDELQGRWILISEAGKAPEQPTEIAFMGDSFFRGAKGRWGYPIGGIVRQGSYSIASNEEGLINLKSKYEGMGQKHARYRIDNGTLTLQFVESPTQVPDPALNLKLKRPGDELPHTSNER